MQFNFNWKTLSVAAGLTLWNFYFRIYAGAVKKEQVVDFLAALVRHLQQPLLIISDHLPAHRSRLVLDYIASLQGWISTAYLPALRAGTEPRRVYLGLLEATRVAECLPQRLLATERSSATNSTSHAPPSATDHRLLEAILWE